MYNSDDTAKDFLALAMAILVISAGVFYVEKWRENEKAEARKQAQVISKKHFLVLNTRMLKSI